MAFRIIGPTSPLLYSMVPNPGLARGSKNAFGSFHCNVQRQLVEAIS